MNLTLDEVNKMKVVELRAELQLRGLDQKGVKAVLVDRLLAALGTDPAAARASVGNGSGAASAESLDDNAEDEAAEAESPKRATRSDISPVKTTCPVIVDSSSVVVSNTADVAAVPENPDIVVPVESPAKAPSPVEQVPTATSEAVKPVEAATPVVSSPVKVTPAVTSPVKPVVPVAAGSPAKPAATAATVSSAKPVVPVPAASPANPAVSTPAKPAVSTPAKPVVSTPAKPAVSTPAKPAVSTPAKPAVAPAAAASPAKAAVPAKPATVAPQAVSSPNKPAVSTPNKPAVATPTPVKPVGKSTQSPASQGKVENKTVTPSEETKEVAMEVEESGESAKRKLEDNAEEKKDVKKARTETESAPKVVPENEPEFDNNAVILDWYKSDLNLKISTENFLEAEPIVSDEFPFAYGGAKATYGFKTGKIFYEVKLVKTLDVRADFGDLESKHVLRVGWSDLLTDLQLGEEKFSYGFESKAKIYKAGEISDFGETIVEGDVVGAYVDVGTEFVEFRFTKNGTALGEPVQVPKAEVEDKIWFPHILVRNVKFQVNFGSTEAAHTPLEGYEFVGKVESSDSRIRGPQRPEKRADCELIMLVGLACSGKTKWAKEYVKNNPGKDYIILGTSTVVERSVKDPSVITSPKAPKAYEAFMNRAGKFVEKLVDMAPSRRRNYILDQSNVLPSVQRRKCGGFEGFRRRAVVILPSDEEYQKRIKSKEQEQGKSVPKSTILDMKASFQLPEVGELFSEVEYPEAPKADAEKLVSTYNKEGVEAGYGRSGSGKSGNQRGGYFGRGRGGFVPRGGRGFMRGGPRGGRGGMMMRGPPRPPMRGGAPMRPPLGAFRGRPAMGPPPMARGPPPMARGPPVMPHNASSRFAPPTRGRGMMPMRGGPPHRGGGGGVGGGSWQRASGPIGNGQRAPPSRGQGRGSGAPRWSSPSAPKPLGNARPPQVWQQQQPPQQQQSVWGNANNRGFGSGFGVQQQQQPQQQQFVDPWVQHQQVPDQGFGRSWDSMGSNASGNQSNQGGGGGTWQGYGGQQFGGFGRR